MFHITVASILTVQALGLRRQSPQAYAALAAAPTVAEPDLSAGIS